VYIFSVFVAYAACLNNLIILSLNTELVNAYSLACLHV